MKTDIVENTSFERSLGFPHRPDNFNDTPSVNVSDQEIVTANQWIKVSCIWNWITFCLGVPFNMWILFIWYQYARRGGRCPARAAAPSADVRQSWVSGGGSGSRRSNKHLFVASMTLADLLNVTFCSPVFGVWYAFGIEYDPHFCRTLFAVSHVTSVASSLSLLCLNVDKFLYLVFTLRYPSLVTRRKSLVAITIVWALSLIWAVTFVTEFIEVTRGCVVYSGRYSEKMTETVYILFSTIGFILPTALSLLISVHITFIVIRHVGSSRRSDEMLTATTGQQNHSSRKHSRLEQQFTLQMQDQRHPTTTTTTTMIRTRPRNNNGSFKRIAFIFSTTIWTACTCLPYRIILVSGTFVFSPWRYFFHCALITNPVGNPLITLLTMNAYSDPTRRIIKRYLPRRVSSSPSPSRRL